MLGLVGHALDRVELPAVEVRLPRDLADAAAAAWDRDDLGEIPETPEQRVTRHRAGSLALIGLAVKERGRLEGDEVVVPLNAGLIAMAVDASDDLPTE
jgi:hypothetical protein